MLDATISSLGWGFERDGSRRVLDRIGFEVENLEAFCKEIEAKGIKFDRPYSTLASGFGLAFLTDPWSTYIELTEGLRGL